MQIVAVIQKVIAGLKTEINRQIGIIAEIETIAGIGIAVEIEIIVKIGIQEGEITQITDPGTNQETDTKEQTEISVTTKAGIVVETIAKVVVIIATTENTKIIAVVAPAKIEIIIIQVIEGVDSTEVIVEITITVHLDLQALKEIFMKEISTEVLIVVRNTNLSTSLDA